MTATSAQPAWYDDPTARHDLRYWDGTSWTAYVSDHGETSLDQIESAVATPYTAALVGRVKGTAAATIDTARGQLAGSGRLYSLDPFGPLEHPLGGQSVYSCFDRSGSRLASAEFEQDTLVKAAVCDLRSGDHRDFEILNANRSHPGRAITWGSDSVALSPTGRLLVVSGPSFGPILLDVDRLLGGEEVPWFTLDPDAVGVAKRAFAWSPDGRTLACVAPDANRETCLFTWTFPDGEHTPTGAIAMHKEPIPECRAWVKWPDRLALEFSPDSRLLVVGGGADGAGAIEVFDARSGTLQWRSEALPTTVAAIAFAPGGSFLAAGDLRGHMTLWRSSAEGESELTVMGDVDFVGRIHGLGWVESSRGLFVVFEVRTPRRQWSGDYGTGGELGVSRVALPDNVTEAIAAAPVVPVAAAPAATDVAAPPEPPVDLGDIPSEVNAAADYLMDVLGTGDAQQHAAALDALVALGPPALARVFPRFVHPTLNSRLQVDLKTVIERIFTAPTPVELRIPCLAYPMFKVRKQLENELVAAGPSVVESLTNALQSDDAQLRKRAAKVLGRISATSRG